MPNTPSSAEEEYFKQEELRKLREQSKVTASAMEEQDREKLKELHWMHCPKCGLDLTEVKYMGVQVDTCFHCGGMYLDKGEIDKILSHEEPGMMKKMVRSFFHTDESS